jgi:hypothetical protein
MADSAFSAERNARREDAEFRDDGNASREDAAFGDDGNARREDAAFGDERNSRREDAAFGDDGNARRGEPVEPRSGARKARYRSPGSRFDRLPMTCLHSAKRTGTWVLRQAQDDALSPSKGDPA